MSCFDRKGHPSYDRDSVDLHAVMVGLLGAPPGRGRNGGDWWKCPFHNDVNPSLTLMSDGKRWRCYGCGERGDGIDLVRRLRGLDFVRAKLFLQSGGYTRVGPIDMAGRKAPGRPLSRRSGVSVRQANGVVQEAERRLWGDGEHAEGCRRYLRVARGLSDESIRAGRLGMVNVPIAWMPGKPCGISLPWFDADRLTLLRVRQPNSFPIRYVEAYRDRPSVYPSLDAIRPGAPLVVVEGEFDCLLMRQELADLASVVTAGSAASWPPGDVLEAAKKPSRIYLAHDNDDAGDKAGAPWPAGSTRVRPPIGKDWTDAYLRKINLREYWAVVVE